MNSITVRYDSLTSIWSNHVSKITCAGFLAFYLVESDRVGDSEIDGYYLSSRAGSLPRGLQIRVNACGSIYRWIRRSGRMAKNLLSPAL